MSKAQESAPTSIHEKLAQIQQELRVPKTKVNTYGGFNYRSAEQILEVVKPLLRKWRTSILLQDEMVLAGNEYVANSTAIITDLDDPTQSISVKSFAIIDVVKKGMDKTQTSGSAISYARKYALGGLLNIDDGNDNDSHNPPATPARKYQPRPNPKYTNQKRDGKATNNQRTLLNKLLIDDGSVTKQEQLEWLEDFVGLDRDAGLTSGQASKAISILMGEGAKGEKANRQR